MTQTSKKSQTLPFVMWFLAMLLFFYQFIARSSFPTVLTEQFMQYFHLDAVGMGALASCYYWVYTFMQIPAGIIIDKISARAVATVCAACCSGGVLVFIATDNFFVAGLGQMLLGFGSSFTFLLCMKIITTWFSPEQIPMKCSCTIVVGCMGPVVGGPLVSQMVKHFSWQLVLEWFASFGLFLTVVLWLIIRDKESAISKKNEEKKISVVAALKMAAIDKQLWVLSLFTMALYAPLSALGDLWGVSFIKKAYGVDSTVAAFANNMLYIGTVIGSPIWAYFAGRWNSYKKPMTVGIGLALASMGVVIFVPGLPIEVVFALLLQTGLGCGAMLAYSLAMAIFPRNMSATVSGIVNMAAMMSGVILMPLIGCIVNWAWDGTMENGLKVYSVNDFRLGLTTVFLFLLAGLFLMSLVKDRSPKERD
ncbi:MAG: MFS transporter [Holosporaceae bacterium]|jgi:MFS family permease|nr:MFS transporter [Holosporaceae bacterium]